MAGVKDFKTRLMADKAFAAKFADVTSPEGLVDIASKEGYSFSVADVKNNTDLTDAELAAVAGGAGAVFADGYFVKDKGTIFAPGYFVNK